MKPYYDDDTLVRCRWYFADKDAKWYTDRNAFRSMIWQPDSLDYESVGELNNIRPFSNGKNVHGFRGQCYVGTADQWRYGCSINDPIPFNNCCAIFGPNLGLRPHGAITGTTTAAFHYDPRGSVFLGNGGSRPTTAEGGFALTGDADVIFIPTYHSVPTLGIDPGQHSTILPSYNSQPVLSLNPRSTFTARSTGNYRTSVCLCFFPLSTINIGGQWSSKVRLSVKAGRPIIGIQQAKLKLRPSSTFNGIASPYTTTSIITLGAFPVAGFYIDFIHLADVCLCLWAGPEGDKYGKLKLTRVPTSTQHYAYTYTPSGSLFLSNQATSGSAIVGTGGTVFTGMASVAAGYRYNASGPLTLTGSTTQTVKLIYGAAGGLAVTGVADTRLGYTYTYTPSGTLLLTGTPSTYITGIIQPTGSLTLTGLADYGCYQVGSGTLTLTGVAPTTYTNNYFYTPSGSLKCTGLADYGCYQQATGTLTLTGVASCSSSSGGSGITGCGCTSIPSTLTLTITNNSGCSCAAGTYTLTWRSGCIWETNTMTICGSTGYFKFEQNFLTQYALFWSQDAASANATATCNPFSWSYTGVPSSTLCGGGTYNASIS